jgi:dTDP-4-dehydrorhamnose reductase
MSIHDKDIKKSININIIGTANIVKICEKKNVKLIYFSTGYVYPCIKGNYKETDPVKPFNNYGYSKLGGECAVQMYKNSLILRITMTEKPFVHQKGYTNLYSNYIYQEEVVKILPKIIDKFGIINIGGKTRSVYSFGKIHNSKIVKLKCVDKKIPLKQTMNLKKLKKILDQ